MTRTLPIFSEIHLDDFEITRREIITLENCIQETRLDNRSFVMVTLNVFFVIDVLRESKQLHTEGRNHHLNDDFNSL